MIYFVQRPGGGDIKIGTTIRLSVRLKQLEVLYGSPLVVLGIVDGSYADERALHREFKPLRSAGEWFVDAPTLREFINRECRPWDGTDESPAGPLIRVSVAFAEAIKEAASFDKKSVAGYSDAYLAPIVQRQFKDAMIRRAKGMEGQE